MRRHLMFLACVAVLIAVLTACGSKKDDDYTMATKTPAATETAAGDTASASPAANSEAPQEVTLIASAETFKYDQAEYHVKKGVPVHLTLKMKDGKHGANLPDFNINLNEDNPTADFTPDKAGNFLIKCSVPCGSGHMTMTATLVVE